MHPIERKIAEQLGKGHFIAAGCFGKVYAHGDNRVYKEAVADCTGVWLERCFAIQKRLGINHPLCEYMPEVFSFRWNKERTRYVAVMRKYTRIYEGDGFDGVNYYNIPAWDNDVERVVEDVIGQGNANDLHKGNILWCRKDKRWVVVDPSFSEVSRAGPQDPKFNRAKRVATPPGPQRRQ